MASDDTYNSSLSSAFSDVPEVEDMAVAAATDPESPFLHESDHPTEDGVPDADGTSDVAVSSEVTT